MKKSKLFVFCFLVIVVVGLFAVPASASYNYSYCPDPDTFCHDYCAQWGYNYLCWQPCYTYVYPQLCSSDGLCCEQNR